MYTGPAFQKKEGEFMTNKVAIRNIVREKSDIDELIFATKGKEAGQTHSDR